MAVPQMANTKTDQIAILRAISALVSLLPNSVKIDLLRECVNTAKGNPDWDSGMEWSISQTRGKI